MISIVLCGGVGSRLWPLSREEHPKPFIKLPDGKSLIQKAFERAAKLPWTESLLAVTNPTLCFKMLEEFKATHIDKKLSFILEPIGRNTAPAIASATFKVVNMYGPDMPILVLAADHLVIKENAFSDSVAKALELAQRNYLVTFGVTPNSPQTGFGYIKADGHKVLLFDEKPTLDKTMQYIKDERFLWNAGIFCFKAGVMLQELQTLAPDLTKTVRACVQQAKSIDFPVNALKLNLDPFEYIQPASIDDAIMSKSDKVAVVPCDIGWADVGTWDQLCALQKSNKDDNRITNPDHVVALNTTSCDIHNTERLITTIGLDNLLIVDTPDALLVADKDQLQEIKELYKKLKVSDKEVCKKHRTVYRPWGSYTVLKTESRFQIKQLEIIPNGQLSMQLHHHRSEHWIVVSGMAEVTRGDESFFVSTNESTFIKAGIKHRVANRGILPLVMIEVQSGDYLGEDDIVRLEDIYEQLR